MSNINHQPSRKIWQLLNQKSRVVTTIAVLAVVAFQIYSWSTRSAHSQSSPPQAVQQSLKEQSR